uniref:Uncharacterized protein n=1 Tax=Oreochromis niloticus TaxID=8128 RepID=A0A669E053_ORENI
IYKSFSIYENFLSLSPQVGDKSFPLEAVKQLKKIMELDENVGPHSDAQTFKTVCANPLVPQVFRPVCQRDEEVSCVIYYLFCLVCKSVCLPILYSIYNSWPQA